MKKEITKSVPVTKRMVWEGYKKVRANKGAAGVDEQTFAHFEERLADNLYVLWNRMASGSYMPPAIRVVQIPKKNGKFRDLGIPTVTDRTAQMVVKDYLEQRYEKVFCEQSYGYRPNRSAHQALDKCRKNCYGQSWVIDLDIKGFFDNLDHEQMMKMLEEMVSEKWIKIFIKRWLTASAMKDDSIVERRKGTPPRRCNLSVACKHLSALCF